MRQSHKFVRSKKAVHSSLSAAGQTSVETSAAQKRFLQRERHTRYRIHFFQTSCFLLFAASWEMTARLGILDDFVFSSPSRMLRLFLRMSRDGSLFLHTGITLLETLLGFLFVTVLGIGLALLLWCCKGLAAVLEPYLVVLNSLPKSAMAPILIVWLGTGMNTIVTASVSVAVFGAVLTMYTGFSGTDPGKIRLIYTLGGTRRDVLQKVIVPASLPLFVSTMKVNIGLCLIGVIIGEFLAARSGLGYLIIYGSQVFEMDLVMLSIVILCIISAVFYKGISVWEGHIAR